MKKIPIGGIISIALSLLLTETGAGQEAKSIKFNSHKKSFSIQKSGSQRLKAETSIEKLYWKSTVEKTTREFTDLYLPNGYYIGNIGEPKLPAIKKLILVPANASLRVEVNGHSKKEISLSSIGISSPVIPVQPSVKKSQDPSSVKFEYNKSAYSANKYSNTPLVSVEYLGTMRGVGIARVVIAPVSYNPIKESIIVSNDIDFDIIVNGSTGADINTDDALKSNYFQPIYRSIEKSSGSNSYNNHKDLTKTPTKMLIIANRLFEEALKPFVKWKTRKGFEIETAFTDEIGSSATDIKQYINKVYNNATETDPAPTFLVIAGDTDRVPASAVGSASEKQTDLYYASLDGDYFPEMYYGRLSASTVEQMNNIVSKILHYEQYQFEDPTYLSNITLIAGKDSQWNPQVGQATIKYGTANYFNANKGFNSIFEYGVSNDPNNPGASAGYDGCYEQSRFRVGIINYTAHCDEKHWQDPVLTQSAVRNTTNTNHYPVAIGNCCLSGDFGTEECIGETWIRQKNTGAVSYIGSSPSTYWFEDFYWSVGAFPMSEPNNGYVPSYDETTLGAYDAPFVSDYTTLGAMVFVGNLAVTEVDIMSYPSQSSPLYYWQAYNILGDPSISPYFAQAQDNRVTLPESIRFDQKEITLEAAPGSLVALSTNNQALSKGVTDETSKVTLSTRSLESPQEIECVITKAQRVPFIKTIKVLPAEQAYITTTKTSVNDAQFNNNGIAEYGEDFRLDLTVANYGETNGENIAIAIYNKDKYFSTLSDTSKLIGNIEAKTVTIAKDAFAFGLATNVPDQHKANIEVHSTDGASTWVSALSITANAPHLEINNVNVTDSLYGTNDKQINPGESVRLGLQIKNAGHASAHNTKVTLLVPENIEHLVSVVSSATIAIESIVPTETKVLSYDIVVNPIVAAEEIELKAAIAIEGRTTDTISVLLPVQLRETINMISGTVDACNILFFDSGGESQNYATNSNIVNTFNCNVTGSRYQVEFLEFNLENGYDYLYIYDGSNENSPQIQGSPFTGNTKPAAFTTSSGTITFKFTSDQAITAAGWKAKIDQVFPTNLPSIATKPIPENGIVGYNSNKLSWEAEGASEYDIYFGNQNALALTQTILNQQVNIALEPHTTYYWKVVPRNLNGQANAENIETWSFTTGNMYQDILMQDGVFFVDSAMFYDQGGPNANYPNKTTNTCTIYPKVKGTMIEATFTKFHTESNYDSLVVFNGNSTSNSRIKKLSGEYKNITIIPSDYNKDTLPITITSTHPSGALTFRFTSDVNINETGWEAKIKSIAASTEKTLEVKVLNGKAIVADAMVNLNGTIKPTNSNGVAYFKALPGSSSLTTHVSQYLPVLLEITVLANTDTTRVTVNYANENPVLPIVFEVKDTDSRPVFTGDISITSSNVNRWLTTGVNGCATTIVPLGEHNVTVGKTGYSTYSSTIMVTESSDTVKVALAMSPVSLQVNVFDTNNNPLQDVTITLNKTSITTNSQGVASTSLDVGEHLITVEKEGYETAHLWRSIKEASNNLTISLKQKKGSYLATIISKAFESSNYLPLEGSSISIYNNNTLVSSGVSSAKGDFNTWLGAGTFTVTIETANYQNPAPATLVISNDNVSLTILSRPNSYNLTISVLSNNSPVEKALVTVKGYLPVYTNSNGVASFEKIAKASALSIVVEKEGYQKSAQYVDIAANTSVQILLSPVGVETNRTLDVRMYPNPAIDYFIIESDYNIATASIFSLQGQLVKQLKPTINPLTVPISDISNGMYIVTITTKDRQQKSFKLIKR